MGRGPWAVLGGSQPEHGRHNRPAPAHSPEGRGARKDPRAGAVTVVNLFSWRATKPADLKRATADHDIIGTRNNDVIAEISGRSPITLAAWGAHGSLLSRGVAVTMMLNHPVCLGVTAIRQARHPLYVRAGTELRPYGPFT